VVVPLARPDPEAAAPGAKIRPPPSPAVGRPRRPLRRTRSHLCLDLLESSALWSRAAYWFVQIPQPPAPISDYGWPSATQLSLGLICLDSRAYQAEKYSARYKACSLVVVA